MTPPGVLDGSRRFWMGLMAPNGALLSFFFCNTKLKAQLEKKEPVDNGTDEEFEEEKEFENEQQQEAETWEFNTNN